MLSARPIDHEMRAGVKPANDDQVLQNPMAGSPLADRRLVYFGTEPSNPIQNPMDHVEYRAWK
jgi:hypothetical protein